MRFSTIAIPAFFGALAAASNETVSIKDFGLRQNNGTVQAAWFNVEPENVYCSGNTTAQLDGVITCGQSAFRFYLEGDNLSEYNLTVYKQLAPLYVFSQRPINIFQDTLLTSE